jgi:hypothetical protein
MTVNRPTRSANPWGYIATIFAATVTSSVLPSNQKEEEVQPFTAILGYSIEHLFVGEAWLLMVK